MKPNDELGIDQFLNDYPGISLWPSRSSAVVLKGSFAFQAKPVSGPTITDSYELLITVPSAFPRALPKVVETDSKIPRDGRHHVNPDRTLCLGSPVRLLSLISSQPTLVGLAEKCIVPFLYAVSNKLLNGVDFLFNELAHGEKGIVDDYLELFGVKTREQVIQVLNLLGTKRRIANKGPCPCGCGIRLGRCQFNMKLNKYRTMAPRSWFKGHVANIWVGM